jgi:hypothetical protein
MDFITIKEYFYKFHSRLLMMLLLPIAVFIALYLQHTSQTFEPIDSPHLSSIVAGAIITTWAIYMVLHIKKIKSARNGKGLRQKLEKYFRITIVRYTIIAVTSFVFAAAFFVTRNDYFTYGFGINLLIAAMFWPGAKKVSSDLRLKGDERTMVYYKRDVL